ncbi:Acyl-CoA N-acyltransferase protein [Quillaja saponaria]|uniref:Acyl-CoA N-acyltransferase protein n=1 Tax=Quillaja saponaria TaxID=32244 RepID=A0AAD7LEJ2_QUISA|nr:Acyl-CoA N-acyltransferase protein [Quillaja saponaria]
MALLSSSSLPLPLSTFHSLNSASLSSNCGLYFTFFSSRTQFSASATSRRPISSSSLCTPETPKIDKSLLAIDESFYEDELWAASCLRVRCFYEFRPNSYGIQDHKRYLAEREFEALKERVAGKRAGFRRVSCLNATLPSSHISSLSDDLCTECKFSFNGEDRSVIGTLDLNQCSSLPDEIAGTKPEGNGADLTRAYLSNVCVAKELQRNGLGYALIEKSKIIARDWGISDLYVHVAVENEPAKKLYMKSGFVYETDEPARQARFLDRPRRILLWTAL